MIYYKAPLSWPESIPVTKPVNQSSDSDFSTDLTVSETIEFLNEEIEKSGIAQVVLYCDVEQPHVERLRKKVGKRTGVCLHVKHYERGYIITCDRWQRLEHNIYAIHLLFRQWNNMVKWGVGSLSKLMAGFEADRAPESIYSDNNIAIDECLKEFGLGANATLEDATAIYHRRAKQLADDNDKLTALNLQMDRIREYFAGLKH
ncbi:MAG: hypothetical protein R3D71_04635 [Rickettsiales bacterium]